MGNTPKIKDSPPEEIGPETNDTVKYQVTYATLEQKYEMAQACETGNLSVVQQMLEQGNSNDDLHSTTRVF